MPSVVRQGAVLPAVRISQVSWSIQSPVTWVEHAVDIIHGGEFGIQVRYHIVVVAIASSHQLGIKGRLVPTVYGYFWKTKIESRGDQATAPGRPAQPSYEKLYNPMDR